MASYRSLEKSIRSHSIHVAVERDFNRMRRLQKQDIKHEKDFLDLERKLNSHAKWNQHADQKNLNQTSTNHNDQKRPSMTLDEFMQHEKAKYDIINNSKKVANERIRHH